MLFIRTMLHVIIHFNCHCAWSLHLCIVTALFIEKQASDTLVVIKLAIFYSIIVLFHDFAGIKSMYSVHTGNKALLPLNKFDEEEKIKISWCWHVCRGAIQTGTHLDVCQNLTK